MRLFTCKLGIFCEQRPNDFLIKGLKCGNDRLLDKVTMETHQEDNYEETLTWGRGVG